MHGRRARRGTTLLAAFLLSMAVLGVAEHEAESPPPYAVGEEISEVAHEGPDRSLHLEAAVVKPPHTCVVCWLGSPGLAVPTRPTALGDPTAATLPTPPVPALACALSPAAPSRGPPLS